MNIGVPRPSTGRVGAPHASGRLIAQNTGLNLLGQMLPAMVAIATIPYTIHGLGLERFALLSLAWAVLGYLTLFDLGLGRATVRFIADAMAGGEPDLIPGIVWTALAIQAVVGTTGAVGLIVAAPYLAEHVLTVPAPLASQASSVLRVVAIGIPILICSASLRGVLEGHQRFALLNAIRAPLGAALFAVPAMGVALGQDLVGIMLGLLGVILVGALCYLLADLRISPAMRSRPGFEPSLLLPLMRFGGWVTLSGVLVPLILYSDRFVLATRLPVALLPYYTIPYDMVSRLQVIPASLAAVLFPAFTSAWRLKSERLFITFSRSVRYLALIMGTTTIFLIISANGLLSLWLGRPFAIRATLVMQLLVAGVCLNALAQIPAHFLDGINRPDLRAKVFLIGTAPYLMALWLLVGAFGILGAAMAWLVRSAGELAVFFTVAAIAGRVPRSLLTKQLPALAVVGAGSILALFAERVWNPDPLIGIAAASGAGLMAAATLWATALNNQDRQRISRWAAGFARRS